MIAAPSARTETRAGASARGRRWLIAGWFAATLVLVGVRCWNALTGPLFQGYDDFAHIGYVLFLDRYAAVPWADQGWSYFHPPLHYMLGWGLAQFDDAIVLVRGLALVSNSASLGIAALAAWITRLTTPERPALALLAFISVGLLPVYLYSSTTAGNEMTAAFFATLGFALFIANECRERPTGARSAWAGFAIGLALLTKVSALSVLGAVGLALLVRQIHEGTRQGWTTLAARGAAVAGVALLISGPFFIRNLVEYGTPSRLGTDFPETSRLEHLQPPGGRSWLDFVYVPLDLLGNLRPDREPLVHSVWGSAYAHTWADLRGGWKEIRNQQTIRRGRQLLILLGLGPTLMALLGSWLALRDIAKGRRRAIYVPLFSISAVSLLAFGWFAISVPHFSALKATYLLGLTLPFAAFLARALEALGSRPLASSMFVSLVVAASGASAVVNTSGWVIPRLPDRPPVAALHFYFEEFDLALQSSERRLRGRLSRTRWRDNVAAIALARGHAGKATDLYAADMPKPGATPFRWNSVAVSMALAGGRERALSLFDEAIAAGAGEVGYANRGVLHASLGNLLAAEADLRKAMRMNPHLGPAWNALAEVLARSHRFEEANDARASAERASRTTPRGHPYGVPDGLAQRPGGEFAPRWLLWLEGETLMLARPPFRPEDAIHIATER